MGNKTKSLIIIGLVSMILTIAIAAVVTQYYYPNIGVISSYSLEMYLDTTLYANTTAIDWGTCEPGYTYYFDNMTVLNTGNTALNISIIAENLPADWTLTWTANNTVLLPAAKVEASLELTIPASASVWPTWGFNLIGEE